MNPARLGTHWRRDVLEKGDHVVIGALLDFADALDVEGRFPTNHRGIFLGNCPELGHRLAGEDLDFEPDLQLALLAPERAHLRQGIAFDHRVSVDLEASPRPIEFSCLRPPGKCQSPSRPPDEGSTRNRAVNGGVPEELQAGCVSDKGISRRTSIFEILLGGLCGHVLANCGAGSREDQDRAMARAQRSPSSSTCTRPDEVAVRSVGLKASPLPKLSFRRIGRRPGAGRAVNGRQ